MIFVLQYKKAIITYCKLKLNQIVIWIKVVIEVWIKVESKL